MGGRVAEVRGTNARLLLVTCAPSQQHIECQRFGSPIIEGMLPRGWRRQLFRVAAASVVVSRRGPGSSTFGPASGASRTALKPRSWLSKLLARCRGHFARARTFPRAAEASLPRFEASRTL